MSLNFVENIISKDFIDLYEPLHQNGPDYIIETDDHRTWLPNGATKIHLPNCPDPYLAPQSVVTFFRNTVEKHPETLALVAKRNDVKVEWTYQQYLNDVITAAKGFIKLGLQPFHGVGILGFNAPEWYISQFATIFAGGFAAGIYQTNAPAACLHLLNDCKANIVIVDSERQLQKILEIKDKLPHLKSIIQYQGKPSHPDILSWDDLMAIGNSVPQHILDRRVKGISINQCCCLIYTSGTTGNSKGVMVSHSNLLTMLKVFGRKCWAYEEGNERIVSYLPLNHIAALAGEMYLAVLIAATVTFAPPDALKDKLIDILLDVKPTSFIAVPRIFEKIYEAMQNLEDSLCFPKNQLLKWAREYVYNCYKNAQSNQQMTALQNMNYNVAKKVVQRELTSKVGLDCTKSVLSGGAPISTQILNYFLSVDVFLQEGYGLSESCGYHIGTTKSAHRVGSAGNINTAKEFEVKILNPDETGTGEVLVRGGHVFMGYLQMEDQTKETIDDERWLHTGDLGRITQDEYLFITGRIKELIITSGGENVPPLIIEDVIKQLLPVVSQCVLVGDKRKYLTMLITLKTEVENFKPLDKLNAGALKWCQEVGSKATTVSEIIRTNDSQVMKGIQTGIDEYNAKKSISNAQKIQKWKILPQDFSILTGEYGPTGKLKRSYVIEKYSNVIESMYTSF